MIRTHAGWAVALAALSLSASGSVLSRAYHSRAIDDGLTARCTTVNTSTLPQEVIERYEISGDENTGLISCVVQQSVPPAAVPQNMPADVYVEFNPIGQAPEPVAVRQVLDGDFLTYLGTYQVHGNDTLQFHVTISVDDTGTLEMNFEDQQPRL